MLENYFYTFTNLVKMTNMRVRILISIYSYRFLIVNVKYELFNDIIKNINNITGNIDFDMKIVNELKTSY